jgi:hypothetical protein
MNAERSQVISGIGRYARGQAEIASRLRKEASRLGELQMKPDTDIAQVQTLTDRLNWETRIFEERVQFAHFCVRGADVDRAAALFPVENRRRGIGSRSRQKSIPENGSACSGQLVRSTVARY